MPAVRSVQPTLVQPVRPALRRAGALVCRNDIHLRNVWDGLARLLDTGVDCRSGRFSHHLENMQCGVEAARRFTIIVQVHWYFIGIETRHKSLLSNLFIKVLLQFMLAMRMAIAAPLPLLLLLLQRKFSIVKNGLTLIVVSCVALCHFCFEELCMLLTIIIILHNSFHFDELASV